MEYAIVDIETTGNAAQGSITEIAIRIFDGSAIIDSYESLVKPNHPIPLFITALTGIDYNMVCNSPTFEDVAKTVYTLLEGRIFVAHHVNFDYSILKSHLEDAGFTYTAPKLCTVRMARNIKPGLSSYSLGDLCEALQIPLHHRHRAGGDVDATVALFSKLLEWDSESIVAAMLKDGNKEPQLPPKLSQTDFDALPHKPGVYYFLDTHGKVIYVGKAKDISKRVAQHFRGKNPNPQRQYFLQDIHSITFEVCGTELMAFILEAIEIKRIWPKYNRALKKYEPKFGIFSNQDLGGYRRLSIRRYDKSTSPIQIFTTREGCVNKIRELARHFGLCASLCGLRTCDLCSMVDKKHNLLCTANEPPETYNEKVNNALSGLEDNTPGFYIVDKGRNGREKSCIWVENGSFYGMGYIDNAADINSLDDIKDSLTRYPSSHYIMQLLISFMCRHPKKIYKVPYPQ